MSCISGYFLFNYTCGTTCPVRYFGNTRSNICQDCPYDCLTCNNNGTCRSCLYADNRLFSNKTLRCVPFDLYFDNETRIALPCPTGCLSCSSMTKCASCLDGYFLIIGGLCYLNCPARYIVNLKTLTC